MMKNISNIIKKNLSLAVFVFLAAAVSHLLARPVLAAGPVLSLEKDYSTYYIGQTFTINAVLTASGSAHTRSDLVLTFDPTRLEVVSLDQGSLYWNYYSQTYDNASGSARISGSYWGSSQISSGTMASITFRAKAAGVVTLDTSNTTIYDGANNPYVSDLPTTSLAIATATTNAALSLRADYAYWGVNDPRWISINLNTQGNNIAGADVVLQYDPAVLRYVSHQAGSLFPNQPGFDVNQQTGRIYLSGVANQGSPINTAGQMARLQFEALRPGPATVSFVWSVNSTTDTNIVSYNQVNTDLLSSPPDPLTLEIGNGGTVSFSFDLQDFLGDRASMSGTLQVGPNTLSFSNPSAAGVVSGLALGTLNYGSSYNAILRVPGYLRKQVASIFMFGANPASGVLEYGALTPGDINGDDVVNTFDLSQIFSAWNNVYATMQPADLNGDHQVNTFDVAILYKYFNQSVSL